jgi:hypothetical protein
LGNPNDWVRVKLEDSQLDRQFKCWSKGDKVYIQCGKRKEVYCNDWDYKRTGIIQCKGQISVHFSSDGVSEGTGSSFVYDIQREPELNACGEAARRVLDQNAEIVDNSISIWPMAKNKACRFEVVVAPGKKAMLSINRAKTFLAAREKFDRKKKRWTALKCYDRVDVFQADGKTKIGYTCGKRSLRYKYKFSSNTNKLVFVLRTDARSSRRERFDAYFTAL